MSLNSLASSRVAREVAPQGTRAASDDTVPPKDLQNALSALVEYVPAETITLYLAVASALSVLQRVIPQATPKTVYWTFVFLTPVLFALIYAGKRKASGQPRWPGWKEWPWWPMCAATIAFAAWALTAPNRAYFAGEAGDITVGLLAIVVSVLLGVVARFFGTPGS